MESSDHDRSSDNSDSFFAVSTLIESAPESERSDEAKIDIEKYHPKYLFMFLYLFDPIFLIFCAMSTTSLFGLFFLLIITTHITIINQSKKSFKGIYAILYFEILYSLLIFIIAIVCNSNPDDSLSSKIAGSNFDTIITDTPAFAIFATFLSIVLESIPISLMSHTTFKNFQDYRCNFFKKTIPKYIVDVIQCFSIAFLGSTSISFLFYPILVYFLYCTLSCTCVGRPVASFVVTCVMNAYTLLYALFQFYMVSFVGEYWDPSEAIKYEFIGTQTAKAFCIVFSSILVYTTILLLSSPGWYKNEERKVPYFMRKTSKFLLVSLCIGVLIYAIFFPNYCTILWMIIIFFISYTDIETFQKLFFPFFSFIYSLSFTLIATTQFKTLTHFQDDGRDQPFTFMKLFGMFKYVDSISQKFSFNCVGFHFLALIGQIGRVVHTEFEKKRKFKLHKYDHLDNINDSNLESQIKKVERQFFWINHWKRFKRGFAFLFNIIYRFLVLISLPVCCVVGIYSGFNKTKWIFTLFSFLFVLIVLLFLYKRCVFLFIRFVSACIILICSFYKSSDSYHCRGQENCLYFGYFEHIDEIGIAPSPDESFSEYIWPVIFVFFLSVFITYDRRCLQVYYSSIVTFLIYSAIAIDFFIYVFLFDLTLFSIIYMILGFLMIATLVMHWWGLRRITILMSFIACSIQLAFYSLAQNNGTRNFLVSRISKSIIDVSSIDPPTGEIIIISFNIFFCSIVFYGNQKLKIKYIFRSFLQILRRLLQNIYFYVGWLLIFGFSLVNQYPSLIKFFFLLIFAISSVSAELFNHIRYPLLIVFSFFLISQCVFELFITDLSPLVERVLRYIGLYLTKDNELTLSTKNWTLGWQFFFILISILNLKKYEVAKPQDNYENCTIYRRLYHSVIGMFHSFLPVIVQVSLFISTTFNKTIFGLITYIFLLCSVYCIGFFGRAIIAVLILLNILFLVQYLLFLGYPRDIFNVKWWSLLDSFKGDKRDTIQKYLTFLGIYDVSKNSLIMNCISVLACAMFLQYNEVDINYQQRYNQLPQLLKGLFDFFTLYFFELSTMFILVVASLFQSIDGLIFFVCVAFFFTSYFLFGYSPSTAMSLISGATFAIHGFRVLSRIPIFEVIGNAAYIKRAFDLPFDGQSKSSGKWIAIFILQQLCRHVMKTDIYSRCRENHVKRCAYRFIRERQLRIIEKLDQSILIKKRNLEINSLNQQSQSTSVFNLSDSKIQLLNNEFKSMNKNEEKRKWYNNLYHLVVEPNLVRFIKLLATCLPINGEAGINVLTLESLTLLMKRCLNYIERNQEFHLEERERQFLLSLPPSFALQFSSISHILESQPIIDPSEYFHRYIFLLLRNIFLPFLVLISIIYLFLSPYIFGLIIFTYVICIFCSIDFKGWANAHRIFFIIVLIILCFRTVSRTDIVNDRLIIASESLTNIQTRISTLSLIGMNPNDGIGIEILLFIASVLFLINQLENVKVFNANYYYEKLMPMLPGFPMEYCYGIMDDPVRNLAMNIPQNRTIIDTMKYTMNRKCIRNTSHHVYMIIIDIISFAILLSHWTSWEGGRDEFSSGKTSDLFTINALFIFILIIHIIFFLTAYFCCLRDLNFVLFWIELIWLLFEFSMIFFYIRSMNSIFLPSCQFYIFLRILQHLIVAHKCFVGRINITYRYPLFATEWKQIRLVNYFIRFCPFVFEIQAVLLWMGRPTYISLPNFCIIRDMELQLEILICNQFDKKKEEKPKNKIRIAIGILLILLFVVIIFIPLLFLISPVGRVSYNPVLLANLQIGVGTLPPFYISTGYVRQISNDEHQELAFSKNTIIAEVAKQIHNSLFTVTFPRYSNKPFQLPNTLTNNIGGLLSSDNYDVSMYMKLDLSFEQPTTVEKGVEVSLLKKSENFDSQKKAQTLLMILGTNHSLQGSFKLPRLIFAITNNNLDSPSETESSFEIIHEQTNSYGIAVDNSTIDLSFMSGSSDYTIIVYSQPVSSNKNSDVAKSVSGNFIGVYLLMVIILGIVVRELVVSMTGNLWKKRMDNPIKLYRMIVTIGMFKNAGDIETEKEMSDQFLNTLRSHEKVIEITSNNYKK